MTLSEIGELIDQSDPGDKYDNTTWVSIDFKDQCMLIVNDFLSRPLEWSNTSNRWFQVCYFEKNSHLDSTLLYEHS